MIERRPIMPPAKGKEQPQTFNQATRFRRSYPPVPYLIFVKEMTNMIYDQYHHQTRTKSDRTYAVVSHKMI